MTNGQTKTFEIGLAMAGAISAGAYSGGVFDFLLQALDEWEKAKAGNPEVPNHQAVIKVLSGASAGAITGAIGTVAFASGVQPQRFDNPSGPQRYRCVLPNLYEAWVVRPRLVSATLNGTDLLSLEDLSAEPNNPAVKSVLNSVLLDQIRDGALNLTARGAPVPYVAKDLHVYLTVSNLRGIPYAIQFQGGGYGMQTHGDRIHYIVKGLGTWNTPSPWAHADAGKPIDVSGLFAPGGASQDWKNFGMAAIASGAFPIGLAPREIETAADDYDTRYMPIDMPALSYTRPAWPPGWYQNKKPRDFNFLCVDGGLINNEPFEYARYTLMLKPPKSNERDGKTADRAVIMIDPFPEPPSFGGDGKPAADLVSVISALFPALVNQARFKPSELTVAVDPEVYSRFLVAPHRHVGGKKEEELYGIACGLLGGFGGFLDEEYRKHDFQLGRRNCQRFLKDVFALPEDNLIIQQWPAGARNNPAFQTETAYDGKRLFCIIPLLGSARDEVVLPPWPRISAADFGTLQGRLKTRAAAVVQALIKRQTNSWWLRGVLIFAAGLSRHKALTFVRNIVLSDLIRRDQIAGWELPEQTDLQAIRNVLAELARPSFDYRTPEGVARSTGLPVARVNAILSFLEQQSEKPYLVWRSTADGRAIYTLDSRRPSRFWQLPVISTVGEFLTTPVID